MSEVKNKKNTTIVANMGSDEKKKEVKRNADERGMSISGFVRGALDEYITRRINEPAEVLNIVELTQKLNDLKDYIPTEDFKSMQENIGNIMLLKGGDCNANI